MDPALKTVLDTMNSVLQQNSEILLAMKNGLASQTNLAQAPNLSVNFVSNFEYYDDSKETFRQYRGRPENWFDLRGIRENKNLWAKELLLHIGPKLHGVLWSLTASEKPADMTYDNLVNILEEHLCPKPNVIVQQHRFLSKIQREGETIGQYVAELRNLASTCKFECECQRDASNLF